MNCFIIASLLFSVCAAFRMNPRANSFTNSKKSQLQMSIKPASGVIALLTALTFLDVSPTYAASYGGFGGNYAEVVSPKDAVLNDETASSEDVKDGLSKILSFKQSLVELKKELASNAQYDASSAVVAKLNPGVLRTAMNKFNTAFSEDTQRGTDRLIRNIIQDVTELQRQTIIKTGKSRSAIKVDVINKRIDTAISTLDELASFLPK